MMIRNTWRGISVGDRVSFVDADWHARIGHVIQIQRKPHRETQYLVDVFKPQKVHFVSANNMGRVIETELQRIDKENHKAARQCGSPFSLCVDCDIHNQCSRYAEHRKGKAFPSYDTSRSMLSIQVTG